MKSGVETNPPAVSGNGSRGGPGGTLDMALWCPDPEGDTLWRAVLCELRSRSDARIHCVGRRLRRFAARVSRGCALARRLRDLHDRARPAGLAANLGARRFLCIQDVDQADAVVLRPHIAEPVAD